MTINDKPAAPGKPDLAARIDQEKSQPLAWKTVAKRAAVVAIASYLGKGEKFDQAQVGQAADELAAARDQDVALVGVFQPGHRVQADD